MPSLAVFTRDLRIHDNPMLAAAGPDVIPLFVSDPAIERLHGSPNRQAFLAESLIDLDGSLRSLGGRLIHRRGPWIDTVVDVAHEAGAEAIHLSRDVSANAHKRSRNLRRSSPVAVVEHEGLTVVPPDAVATLNGTPYRVFTPYYRSWLQAARRPTFAPRTGIEPTTVPSDPLPSVDTSGTSRERQRGGESEAIARLESWRTSIGSYDDDRNSPAIPTSRLSADLHFGTISPIAVEETASDHHADGFIRQLAWRDFNHQALFHNTSWASRDITPLRHAPLEDEDTFEAWAIGSTGYPLVDAGMRQLVATGWMHNRVRMVTASFLTKHLLIDWRKGARWFLTWLTDGDIANNQLNWQWVAGTGLDSNPHRMFNPTLQSSRHDPHGSYIRRWVPELADVPPDEIHDPLPLTRAIAGYPAPIIEHKDAVARYRHARSQEAVGS